MNFELPKKLKDFSFKLSKLQNSGRVRKSLDNFSKYFDENQFNRQFILIMNYSHKGTYVLQSLIWFLVRTVLSGLVSRYTIFHNIKSHYKFKKDQQENYRN